MLAQSSRSACGQKWLSSRQCTSTQSVNDSRLLVATCIFIFSSMCVLVCTHELHVSTFLSTNCAFFLQSCILIKQKYVGFGHCSSYLVLKINFQVWNFKYMHIWRYAVYLNSFANSSVSADLGDTVWIAQSCNFSNSRCFFWESSYIK